MKIPISCQLNCEIDFIESKNKKYICLRTIKNLKSGESLKLSAKEKKDKYCLDPHLNEDDEFNCKISLSSFKSKCIFSFFKECTFFGFIPEGVDFSSTSQKKVLTIENFEKLITFSKNLKGIGLISQCLVIQSALSISHHVFHKKFCVKESKFNGRSGNYCIKCFPCIMKLRELFNI